MSRRAHDTLPLGMPVDTGRTDPEEAPDVTDPGAPPDITAPLENVGHEESNVDTDPGLGPAGMSTDPGVDPMLEGFNRPPRPPAPLPQRIAESDGAEFAAHYAGPRAPRAAYVPADLKGEVMVQLAAIANEREDPSTDAAPEMSITLANRGVATVVRKDRRPVPIRLLAIAVAAGALLTTLGVVLVVGPRKHADTTNDAGETTASTLGAPPEPQSAPVASLGAVPAANTLTATATLIAPTVSSAPPPSVSVLVSAPRPMTTLQPPIREADTRPNRVNSSSPKPSPPPTSVAAPSAAAPAPFATTPLSSPSSSAPHPRLAPIQ